MGVEQTLKRISKMSSEERLTLGKDYTDKAVDQIIQQQMTFHNRKAMGDPNGLPGKLRPSKAVRAYNSAMHDLKHLEIVRLHRFWQPPDLDSPNLQTIVALIDDPDVIKLIQKHSRELYQSEPEWAQKYTNQKLRSN